MDDACHSKHTDENVQWIRQLAEDALGASVVRFLLHAGQKPMPKACLRESTAAIASMLRAPS